MGFLIDLGPLAGAAAALVALLILYGAAVIVNWVVTGVASLPWPLSGLAGVVRSLEGWVLTRAKSMLLSTWSPVGLIWRALHEPTANIAAQNVKAHQATHQAVTRVVTQHIPTAMNAAESYAGTVADQALSTALGYTGQVEQALSKALGAVYAQLSTRITGVFDSLAAEDTALAQTIQHDVQDVLAWTQQELGTIEQSFAAGLSNLAGWTDQQVHRIDGEVGAVTTWAGSAIDSLRTDIVRGVGQAEQYAHAAAGAVGAGVLGYLGTKVIPAVEAITTTVDECAVPYCSEKNALGKEAFNFGTLLGSGIMLAGIVEMVTHPDTAARDTEAVGKDIVGGVVDAVRALVTNL